MFVGAFRQLEEDGVARCHEALGRRQVAAIDRLPVLLSELLAQPGLGLFLDVDVDCELDVFTRYGRLFGDLTSYGALWSDRGEQTASLTGKNIVHRALEPEGTDLVAGLEPLRAEILQLVFGNLRHIADDMSRRGAVGVDTLRILA